MEQNNSNEHGVEVSGFDRHRFGIVISICAIFCLTCLCTYFYFEGREPVVVQSIQPASSTQPIVVPPNYYANLTLGARSVYVYDIAAHKVLFEKNADTPLPLASLTKVMTALVVSDVLDPDQVVSVPHTLAAPTAPNDNLHEGEKWTIKDLLTYTLVVSSNDGAEYLAGLANGPLSQKYLDAPATSTTIWQMNRLAQGLGLSSMTYQSVSGLDRDAQHAGAYGSAHDVGQLFEYAASTSPALFSGTVSKTITLIDQSGQKHVIHNTDEALSAIPGVIMGKTGYTDLAGGNLAILFTVGPGHPVVAVVMGSTESGRFNDMKALVDATIKTVSE